MTRLLLLIALSLGSLTAHAALMNAVIRVGANKGTSLLANVSQSVPSRAAEEAFTFFDKNEGVKRTASIFAIGADPANKAFDNYVCNASTNFCSAKTVEQTLFENHRLMVIFDLNESSLKPRLHIVDLLTGQVTSLFASHGKGSSCANDPTHACKFVSDRDSDATPLGFFVTGQLYKFEKTGWLIPLIGLQGGAPGAERNDVASTIVIHGAPYASPEFRRVHGYMGRSLGCPAMSFSDLNAWKDRLQGGVLFYFFHDSLPHVSAPASYQG